jgi:hypothetical protein
LFAVGHPAWRKKAASIGISRSPKEGTFVRLAGMVRPAWPVRSAKNKISTGAELVLPIGYYAAAG